jgi:biopolymer transport protein ExbB
VTSFPLLQALALTGGDWVIYILLISSVVAVAVLIERGMLLHREEGRLSELRRALLRELGGDLEALEKTLKSHGGGVAARILQSGLAQAHYGAAGVEDHLVAASLEEKGGLEKRLVMLGTLGNNAPFVGLFGTVLGVIKAFHDLSEAGAGPEVVMRGLSEALIATAVGLSVAIPCVVGYNYYVKQVKDILTGTESLGRMVLAQVRAGKSARK